MSKPWLWSYRSCQRSDPSESAWARTTKSGPAGGFGEHPGGEDPVSGDHDPSNGVEVGGSATGNALPEELARDRVIAPHEEVAVARERAGAVPAVARGDDSVSSRIEGEDLVGAAGQITSVLPEHRSRGGIDCLDEGVPTGDRIEEATGGEEQLARAIDDVDEVRSGRGDRRELPAGYPRLGVEGADIGIEVARRAECCASGEDRVGVGRKVGGEVGTRADAVAGFPVERRALRIGRCRADQDRQGSHREGHRRATSAHPLPFSQTSLRRGAYARRLPGNESRPSAYCFVGVTFRLSRKRLSGSYLRFTSARRSRVAGG